MHTQQDRRRPLPAAALALAIAAALATNGRAASFDRPGAIALHAELRALLPQTPQRPQAPSVTHVVTSCADDNGPDTLRAAVAAAGEGDTIDASALACSSITLSQGAVPVLLDALTISGPAGHELAIDGAAAGRVFVHPGAGALTLQHLAVRNGVSLVSGNHVTGGGCIASAGYVVLDHARVSDCLASGEGAYGGGVFAYALRMYTSVLSANTGRGNDPGVGTAVFGGGAYASTLTLVDSTVSDNRADFDAASASHYNIGGGVFTNRGGTIERSTVAANYSAGIGGGVAAFGGYLDVRDSTLSGNVAQGGSGGALDLRVFDGARIANSTIAGNRALSGGGVYLRGQPRAVVVQSTIVSGNAAAASDADFGSAGATTIGGANNLIGTAGATATLPADTLHADPLLLPLAANGGPTLTRALAAGSPALDAGNNVANLATDQRGMPRVAGASADIGAFEGFISPPAAAVPAPFAARAVLAALAFALAMLGIFRLGRRPHG